MAQPTYETVNITAAMFAAAVALTPCAADVGDKAVLAACCSVRLGWLLGWEVDVADVDLVEVFADFETGYDADES